VASQPSQRAQILFAAMQLPKHRLTKSGAIFLSVAIYKLKSRQTAVLIALLFVTFLAHFYATDLKGIWNDEAVRLTIANGGWQLPRSKSDTPAMLRMS
jgi:hypothetical protein